MSMKEKIKKARNIDDWDMYYISHDQRPLVGQKNFISSNSYVTVLDSTTSFNSYIYRAQIKKDRFTADFFGIFDDGDYDDEGEIRGIGKKSEKI